ncbi:ADP-ribose diphosphatase [Alkalimarinus sediminis]|uniref:ADP-ribose pyrophosphatase n=1 Tax=Alkalimarinus sediminis TaxID=1632866 RepID=A0A9E8HG61_9ALTE|nr:ADP-ribose diphosphatase [Alkalimarinus sediminis]UZW74053.1 ADP-ribose diphosphatase [Alkalimarinus sediminis]
MKEIKQQFSTSDVEVLSNDRAFDGFFKIDRYRLSHRLFKGGWGPELQREVFVREDATCVLPYDADTDQVVLLEQFRVGALGHNQSPWLLELVAGINDAGETPEAVGRREAIEEASIELGELRPICQYLVSPGGTNEKIHLYCGQVDASTAHGIHGLEHEGEDIKVHVVQASEAFEYVATGRINNAASIIALQWLQLNHAILRRDWSKQ